MKRKTLSLLLVLALVIVLAAPASAATYVGLYSREDTLNGKAYFLSARCTTYSARASTSYDDTEVLVRTTLTAYYSDGTETIIKRPPTPSHSAASIESGVVITNIVASFWIGSTEWGAKVLPG